MGHARALLGLANRAQQLEAARQVVEQQLSVRQTEALVRQLTAPPAAAGTTAPRAAAQQKDPDVRALEEDLTGRLGAKVLIQQESGGKGRLVISYNSLDELDGILGHIRRQ
jgi:ParB family chromosome partitioning protein